MPGTVKYFEEESLQDAATKNAIDFKIDADNIFDPKTLFSENGDFNIPKFKTAYLIYILDARKLGRLNIESTYDEATGKIYGSWADKEKTRKKSWNISSVTTIINLNTKDGLAFFMACCKYRTIAGTENTYAKPYFRLEVPELRATAELQKLDYLEEAINYISSCSEEKLDDLSVLLGISGFINKTTNEKKTFMRKLCITDGEKIVEAKKNKDSAVIITLSRAISIKIVNNVSGVYKFGDYGLGITMEQAVLWTEQNPEVWEMIEHQVKLKGKKNV